MENLYDQNGLIFWTEGEIKMRAMFEEYFVQRLKENLKSQNRAFDFFKCEAPLLTPTELINKNYTEEDVWVQQLIGRGTAFIGYARDLSKIEADKGRLSPDDENTLRKLHANIKETEDTAKSVDGQLFTKGILIWNELYPQKVLVLRPETTMGSYAYAKHLLNPHNATKVMPPLVVYQHGKSFRREQDQPSKFMRLKEFYQLEFQILYSPSTKNDYSLLLVPAVKQMIEDMIGTCHVEDSDRIPSYAEWTRDVVCDKSGMEVCSISKRTDYDNMNVIEVAIGTDRCLACFADK